MTVLESEAVPPAPVQVTVYTVVTVGETLCVPLVGEPAPVEKLVPVQEAALDDDHVSTDDWPVVIAGGNAVRSTVGALGLMLTLYEAQPDVLPSESCASALNVCVLEEFQECVAEPVVPLDTYPSAGTYSSTVPLSSQSMPYRIVSESGSVERKVYV